MKKKLSLLLAAALTLSMLASCGPKTTSDGSGSVSGSENPSSSVSTPTTDLPDFMVLSGPTGVGAAKLMADNETAADEDKVIASATVVADNQEVNDALISGNADIAAIAEEYITMQGDGDLKAATDYVNANGTIPAVLQQDLDRIANAGIPKDIYFRQGAAVLGL